MYIRFINKNCKYTIVLLLFIATSFLLAFTVLPPLAFSAPPFDRSHIVHWWDNRGPNLWNGSYPLTCDNCHIDNTVHHEVPILFKDSKELANTNACDNCHSKGGAFDGVAMAKANWVSGVYIGTNYENLQTGKEQWCTTCHDDAAPTINGRTAKNVAGNNTVYGYFISGHGKYDVSCTECHDPQLVHIDSYDRTYAASSNNYTQGYRLKLLNGNTPMVIPRTGPYSSSQFRLCYSCHDENALMDVSPILTDFADFPASSNNNLHVYHLSTISSGSYWDSDFSGETGPMKDSNPSCPACHNPHGKDYDSRATISMTRQDLGLVHKRDVTGLFGHMETFDWGNAGGDVNCFGMCHQSPNPIYKYYYQLGTRPPDAPGFWTKLNSQTDVTNPTYGTGGTFLGGTFTSYDRYGVTETGLSITSGTQGSQFPAGNINSNDEYYGETIDFWYVPNFNFNGNTTTRFLFDYYDDANNFIRIRVVSSGGYSGIDFRITNAGTARILTTNPLYWSAGSVHHVVCTWGPAQGMHMYLDRMEPSYLTSGGLTYYGGINQTANNFYIGRRYDGAANYQASGIIDDFKIYGYQYQKFENGLALFSKMGSAGEINTPVKGSGGSVAGSVNFVVGGQQGYSAQFSSSYKGVVNFPTSDLNPDQDTIDLWYRMSFNIEDNADSTKHLFWYYIDDSNNAFIRVDNNTLNFTIMEGGTSHTLKTTGLLNWDWYHVVCTWGPDGMHIYINDKEASYSVNTGLSYTGGLPTPMPANFQIGNKGQGLNNYCNGYIDELRVYGYQASAQSLEFLADCPVDISVIDPQGLIISKEINEIKGAKYIEADFDGDGSLDDKIIIPIRKLGNYIVLVFPEPGANPTDTYTLKVINGGTTIVLAQDVPVGNISDEQTFEVNFTNSGVKLDRLISPEDGVVLSGPVTFDWESVGFNGFKIEFSSDQKFGQEKLTFPKYKWMSETSFTPNQRQWQRLQRMGRQNVIYWRIIASDDKGNTGFSDTRRFFLH